MSHPVVPGAAASACSALAPRLACAGHALLIALPLAMWLANRSAPLVLALAALCFIASAVAEEGAAAFLSRIVDLQRGAVGMALCTFVLWALVTIAWSHRPAQSLAAWGEMALPMASGLAIAASGRFRPGRVESRALAIAIVAAAILMLAELASDLSVRIALGIGKQMAFIFNRPALTCLMLLPVAAAGLLAIRGRSTLDWLLIVALVFAGGALSLDSDSGAAGLGLLILLVTWLGARLLPRLTLLLVTISFVATMALAPVMGRLGDEGLPPSLHERLAASHSRDRVDIWLSFGEAIMARPLLGSGFGTSPTLDRHPVALEVSPPRRQLLAVGHPHSAPVQAWVETGAVGAMLIGLAGLAFLWRLRRLPAPALAPRLALAAAAFAIATVAHGAWQGWWIAALALAAAWLFRSLPSEDERS
ncbi:O-antigen ligase family protein [Bosea sp. BH3]|uniref:O-antigen ligase family protein n=1 Tax=Bosea sp. BH3 TaxID=2871701 RepID=UPI0021CB1485|nr:O-antigen ligase family protein [Bosea sp. BH3]MCU4182119.1 O-antigen ligase family protein [Bosea sp. BH3]